MPTGIFITFEGGEGTGKSTQVGRLREHLEARGREVVVTREPGGTPLAEAIRGLLLDPGYAPGGLTELFLLEAARHDLVVRVLQPALARGAIVLCDRYADSSTVYQGMVRGVGVETAIGMNELATGGLEPDLTLVFDIDPAEALPRVRSRNAGGEGVDTRLDDEPADFHLAVRRGFLRLAELEPGRVCVIDAAGDPDAVFARLRAVLPEELR